MAQQELAAISDAEIGTLVRSELGRLTPGHIVHEALCHAWLNTQELSPARKLLMLACLGGLAMDYPDIIDSAEGKIARALKARAS